MLRTNPDAVRNFQHDIAMTLFVFGTVAGYVDATWFMLEVVLSVRQTARQKVLTVCRHHSMALLW